MEKENPNRVCTNCACFTNNLDDSDIPEGVDRETLPPCTHNRDEVYDNSPCENFMFTKKI